MQQLRLLVKRYRKACELAALAARMDNTFSWFANFPAGKCRLVSVHLADFLHDNGQLPADVPTHVVCGWREGRSHAWLETGATIIDITDDQFADRSTVTLLTTDRTWHDNFGERESDLYTPDSDCGDEAQQFRDFILKHVEISEHT